MASALSVEECRDLITRHYPVVIGGYSGLGYADPKSVRQKVRSILEGLLLEHGHNLLVVSGGTAVGIGLVYEVAKDLELDTLGIVSELASRKAISGFCDNVFFVADPSGTWEVKSADGDSYLVETARNGQMFYFGGGKVASEEISEARSKGITVSVFSDFMPDSAKVDPS